MCLSFSYKQRVWFDDMKPDSLTTTHTCALLALATHKKAGWVDDPQVSLVPLPVKSSRVLNDFIGTLPHRILKLSPPVG